MHRHNGHVRDTHTKLIGMSSTATRAMERRVQVSEVGSFERRLSHPPPPTRSGPGTVATRRPRPVGEAWSAGEPLPLEGGWPPARVVWRGTERRMSWFAPQTGRRKTAVVDRNDRREAGSRRGTPGLLPTTTCRRVARRHGWRRRRGHVLADGAYGAAAAGELELRPRTSTAPRPSSYRPPAPSARPRVSPRVSPAESTAPCQWALRTRVGARRPS